MQGSDGDLGLGELDLIAALTPQSHWGLYERQIREIDWPEGFELPSLEEVAELEAELEAAEAAAKPKSLIKTGATSSKATARGAAEPSDEEQLQALAARLGPIPQSIRQPRVQLALPENDSFEQLEADIEACTACELCKTRAKVVVGAGNKATKLMFIGQSPRSIEESANSPLAGEAFEHLRKIISAAGFNPDEIYLCNIIKCKTPADRAPFAGEITACSTFLHRQISLIKPQLIACLGTLATKTVIGPRTPSINRVHGRFFDSVFQIPAMPMFHPIQLAQDPSRAAGSPNWAMWQDIKALKKKYDELK
jgi:uracil-DNA glycosylase family 4